MVTSKPRGWRGIGGGFGWRSQQTGVPTCGLGFEHPHCAKGASFIAQLIKNPPAMQETPVQFLGREDPLEKGKATHSSILARRIPWTVQSMGSQRVRHD